ncbi:uncharacterized protein EV420DRAFT_1639117 [Desarmillaria tabescens]|uniref:Fungal-type protein kinase domain-containing protein n=1 Tax=Armillaria tabescens TaxID=1929756 RepID=A0AA39T409_ARMTA|nr:uncharacterized protein EV420DRAFT_1639117 [Desarmillaria tabescens]KAK0463031.1 hypothetical protein EV420DRAFT_1639117 [Desarmillaria tabescens]
MPADDFFTNILHIPHDWRTSEKIISLIRAIKDDAAFIQHVKAYSELCQEGPPCKSAFDALCATNDSSPGVYRQDVKPANDGLQKDDHDTPVGVLRAMFNSSRNVVGNMVDDELEHNFSCVQTMHWQEFKSKVSDLNEGTDAIYRVLTIGRGYPQEKAHRDPGVILPLDKSTTSKKRHRSEDDTSRVLSKYARSGMAAEVSDARKASENLVTLSSVTKVTAGDEEESKARPAVRPQCGLYALDMVSSTSFRTRCIGVLVALGRVQLIYYDCSVIIVCDPIDMFERDAEPKWTNVDPLKRWDILEAFCDDKVLIDNPCIHMDRCGDPKDGKGLKFKLYDDKMVEVTLGQIISRAPGIVGRNTCVVEATSEHEGRRSEAELVKTAREKALAMTRGKKPDWALDHLPDILLSQDVGYDADSTQANLANFFENALLADKMTVDYEKRVCRITVQERLYPFEELKTAKTYAQVFFDILQIHKWLYDHPRILQQDISPGNIIWRRNANGDLCGVLNDFDLSTLRDATGPSSAQRTGTLPYMAYELLINDKKGYPPKHLYRHGVESIFYVISLLCYRYKLLTTSDSDEPEILKRIKVPSDFDDWYKLSRPKLKKEKGDLFMDVARTVNNGFADFQPWLSDLHQQLRDGHHARGSHITRRRRGKATGPYDDETPQGHVSYSIVLDICRHFPGSPLVVHNDQPKEAA